jgi:hypothetical protein
MKQAAMEAIPAHTHFNGERYCRSTVKYKNNDLIWRST